MTKCDKSPSSCKNSNSWNGICEFEKNGDCVLTFDDCGNDDLSEYCECNGYPDCSLSCVFDDEECPYFCKNCGGKSIRIACTEDGNYMMCKHCGSRAIKVEEEKE
jgi:DNA-directed RNA polymerase subunit RPC12/RpoP